MSSILTNNGAMVALQTLKGINASMAKTQDEISTGKSVATAKDNAAVWAVAKTMEADVASFKAIDKTLSIGQSTVAVARSAAESVTDLLGKIKTNVIAAQVAGTSEEDRAKYQTQIDALKDQIKSVVGAAQFNGKNLINGTEASPMKVTSSLDRAADGTVSASTIDVTTFNLSTKDANGNPLQATAATAFGDDVSLAYLDYLDVTAADGGADVDEDGANDSGAAVALKKMDSLIKVAVNAASAFGTAQSRIEIQRNFMGDLADSLESGVGSLVDANMEEVSARLQALQVQQQLGTQSLSIANSAPQQLLSLFRG